LGARDQSYLSTLLYWRPPGNRPPTQSEIAICLPFVKRQIDLVNPQILVLLGATTAHSLLNREGAIGQLRGKWFDYSSQNQSRPTLVLRHPIELMRTPPFKRKAWQDLLRLKEKLASL